LNSCVSPVAVQAEDAVPHPIFQMSFINEEPDGFKDDDDAFKFKINDEGTKLKFSG
jgi:hypothetical protein